MVKQRGARGVDSTAKSLDRTDVADEIVARHKTCFGDILPIILVVLAAICGLLLVGTFIFPKLIKAVLIFGILGVICIILIPIYRIYKHYF